MDEGRLSGEGRGWGRPGGHQGGGSEESAAQDPPVENSRGPDTVPITFRVWFVRKTV